MERNNLVDISLFILRLALGLVFVLHGLQKVFGMFGGPGMEGFTGFMGSLKLAQPAVWAWAVAIGELAGGIFLALGILPRVSAAVLALIMAGAVVFVHGSNGYFAANGGYEYPLLIFMVSVALIFSGGGRLSLLNKF
jgi:putative oxidoreductase